MSKGSGKDVKSRKGERERGRGREGVREKERASATHDTPHGRTYQRCVIRVGHRLK